MNRYLIINNGIIVDIMETEELVTNLVIDKDYDTIQIDNDMVYTSIDVLFDVEQMVDNVVDNVVDNNALTNNEFDDIL